jgi:bifunctional UDP-N-acetylglucosamine pyrophosphorylase/glucosamine-1-phosphate N-acetyltransferase
LGKTQIGGGCRVGSYSVIRDASIGDSVTILPGCIIDESNVKAGATLGPYARLRPGSDIGENAKVGNFVETKKVRLGKGSKANHLTYLGDAEIGEGVNIGAGTILCNYDGVHKHKTTIEDGVFVRSFLHHERCAGRCFSSGTLPADHKRRLGKNQKAVAEA